MLDDYSRLIALMKPEVVLVQNRREVHRKTFDPTVEIFAA